MRIRKNIGATMSLYLDTSALVKLYVGEEGREVVVEATARWPRG